MVEKEVGEREYGEERGRYNISALLVLVAVVEKEVGGRGLEQFTTTSLCATRTGSCGKEGDRVEGEGDGSKGRE